ncbi:type II secretion system protein GspG [Candidatus Poribacteria bacterium]|nr:MAG: type II secretion system protein GspG [Candidatus Poribacteria bacterium]
MFKQLKTDESGLTLIELTIVIAILGILAAFIAPRVIDAIDDARVGKAQTEIASLKVALSLYVIDVGSYPSTEEGLDALWTAPSQATPNWDGPYIQDPVTNDPWGRPYVYRYPGTHPNYEYDLLSYGKDGKLGGEKLNADITNWVQETTAAQ